MYASYFWLAVAAIALLFGFFSRREKARPSTAVNGGKGFLRAIGSPLEIALAVVFLILLWFSGAFDGGNGTFLLGVIGMLVVPILIVFVAFQAIGRASRGRSKGEDE